MSKMAVSSLRVSDFLLLDLQLTCAELCCMSCQGTANLGCVTDNFMHIWVCVYVCTCVCSSG